MPLEQLPERIIRGSFEVPITTYNDPVAGAPCYGFGLKKGMYTDDTQAVRVSAKEIAKNQNLSPAIIADALSGWLFGDTLGQTARYPGVTTREAMKRYLRDGDPLTCGVLSRACGAAIRISPAAIWLSLVRDKDFESKIKEIAQVTHTDRSAVDGALIVGYLVRMGLEGGTPPIDNLLQICSSDLMGKAIARIKSALDAKKSPDEVALELGGGTGAHEVVPMALYHAYGNGFDFERTLEAGLNTFHPSGLDMDSILSISGAICGVRAADSVESSKWLSGLEDAETIAGEAEALFDVCYHCAGNGS